MRGRVAGPSADDVMADLERRRGALSVRLALEYLRARTGPCTRTEQARWATWLLMPDHDAPASMYGQHRADAERYVEQGIKAWIHPGGRS